MAIDSRIPEKPKNFDDEDIVSDDGRIWYKFLYVTKGLII